jgi:hypothetical protein
MQGLRCVRCKVQEAGERSAYLYSPRGFRKERVCDPCFDHMEKVQKLSGADAPVELLKEGMERHDEV